MLVFECVCVRMCHWTQASAAKEEAEAVTALDLAHKASQEVQIASLEAEREQREADEAMQDAEREKAEAAEAYKIAQKEWDEMIEARDVAEKERMEAEEAQAVAERERREAVEARQWAIKERAEAVEARRIFELNRKRRQEARAAAAKGFKPGKTRLQVIEPRMPIVEWQQKLKRRKERAAELQRLREEEPHRLGPCSHTSATPAVLLLCWIAYISWVSARVVMCWFTLCCSLRDVHVRI